MKYLDIPEVTQPVTDSATTDHHEAERETVRALFGTHDDTQPPAESTVTNQPVPNAGRTPAKGAAPGKTLNEWLRGW